MTNANFDQLHHIGTLVLHFNVTISQ